MSRAVPRAEFVTRAMPSRAMLSRAMPSRAMPGRATLSRAMLSRERLDMLGVADERDHHGDAQNEEQALQDVDIFDKPEQVGECPAGRKGRAEHLGADQNGGTQDRDHVDPDDLAAAAGRGVAHVGWVLLSTPNVVQSGGGI